MLALTLFLVQVFTFILQRRSPCGQKGPPRFWQKIVRRLKCNEKCCKPFADGYSIMEAVPSLQRSMMRYLTYSLALLVQSGTDLRAANKAICIRLNCQTYPFPAPCPHSLPRSLRDIKPNKCMTKFIRVIENQDGTDYFSSMLSQEIKINSPTSYFNIAYHNH